MVQTEFMTEIENGPIDSSAITITMIADDTSIALWGPVILADGTITDLAHAASTATLGDRAVFGVCVRLPRDGTLTADTSRIEVCIHGICKVKVNDSTVNLNDALQTNSTAGEAAVRAAFTISAAYSEAEVTAALQGIRACFGIALSTVSSGADSIVAAFINIVPNAGAA